MLLLTHGVPEKIRLREGFTPLKKKVKATR
jgi:hypothetical protein